MEEAVPFALLQAWVDGRSLARSVPRPVIDHGGCRVDTGSPDEISRWIFHDIVDGIADVARAFAMPRHFIKACASCDDLRAALPPGWQVEHTGYFMRGTRGPEAETSPPSGYRVAIERSGPVTAVRISGADGEHAAHGFAAETDRAFVYDRIVVADAHRRRGLGRAVMTTLGRERTDPDVPELLVATDDGRALYETLGWAVLAPYSTASFPA